MNAGDYILTIMFVAACWLFPETAASRTETESEERVEQENRAVCVAAALLDEIFLMSVL